MDHYYWVLEGETYIDNDKYGQTIGKIWWTNFNLQASDASTIFLEGKI